MTNLFDSDSFQSDDDFFESLISKEELTNYRSVPIPQQKYSDLLKQAIKKNRASFRYLRPKWNEKLKQGRKITQRIYRIQRRKDIIKDDYSALVDYGKGLIDQDVSKSFGIGIKHLRKLRIDMEQNLNPEIMENWLKILKRGHLPRIKTLKFDIANWEIFEQYEGRFSIFKNSFPNVENLEVAFSQMHRYEDIPIQDFILNLMRTIRKLKILRLKFYYCKFFKDNHLLILSKALRNGLSSVESLALEFGGLSNLASKTVEIFWKSLDKTPKLKQLKLDCHLSDDETNSEAAFATFCSVLQKKSPTLETLILNLGGTGIASSLHQHLNKALISLLPKLNRLELEFSCRDSKDDESLGLLGDALSNGSNSLKTMTMRFWDSYVKTEKEVQNFAEGIKKGRFPAMEKLSLYFKYTHKMTYDGLYAIAEAISEAFPNLKSLIFLFSTDSRIYSSIPVADQWKITGKAEGILKIKLKNLPKNFHLEW